MARSSTAEKPGAPSMTILEDAPNDQGRRGSAWRLVAIIGGALLAGIAFFGLDFETSVDQLATTTTVPQTLAERLPGLGGSVHAITENGNGTASSYVIWAPEDAFPTTVPLAVPAGRFNIDASQIATLSEQQLRSVPGSELWVGPPDAVVVATDRAVTYAWHDESPDKIAVTRSLEGSNELWLGEFNTSDGDFGFERAGIIPDSAELTGYGEWGASLSISTSGAVLVVDQYASLIRQYSGNPVGHQPGERGGVVLATDGGASIAYRSTTIQLPLPAGGTLRGLDWIAGSARAAVSVVDDGVAMVRVVERDQLLSEARLDAERLKWSPDNRYVVVTTAGGQLVMFDTAASTTTELPIPGRVRDAAVIAP